MINSILAIPVKFNKFIKEHPIYSVIIFTLILGYFAKIPYLYDFISGIIEYVKSLEIITFGKYE